LIPKIEFLKNYAPFFNFFATFFKILAKLIISKCWQKLIILKSNAINNSIYNFLTNFLGCREIAQGGSEILPKVST